MKAVKILTERMALSRTLQLSKTPEPLVKREVYKEDIAKYFKKLLTLTLFTLT